jgi:hypothetical protein
LTVDCRGQRKSDNFARLIRQKTAFKCIHPEFTEKNDMHAGFVRCNPQSHDPVIQINYFSQQMQDISPKGIATKDFFLDRAYAGISKRQPRSS